MASLDDRPLLSLILITYRQEETITAAVRGALAQTYSPLEIVISDDASPDRTFERIQQAVAGYDGPHKIIVHRNAQNLGIGANISQAVLQSHGELVVIAAGDDVSVPHRCERMAQTWIASGKTLDLIASHLVDLDAAGNIHEQIAPTDLGTYRSAQDWLDRPPHVIGAAQAWTRRLFDHFGPLPAGVVAEDLIMVFRAICAGGCATVAEPLVQYRRGGLSGRVRALRAEDTIRRLVANNRHALVEVPLMRTDAILAGCEPVMKTWLDREQALVEFIRDVFDAPSLGRRIAVTLKAHQVPVSRRLRMLTYAGWPWLLAPLFALKRAWAR